MREWFQRLPGKVADAIVVPAVVLALTALAALVLGWLDEEVPAWVLLITAAIAVALTRLWAWRTSPMDSRQLQALLVQVDLHEYYADHLYEVLETLQRAVTGTIPGVGPGEFIERGILEPARSYLTQAPGEDVRLSVQVPEGQDFVMRFTAGHSLEGRHDFRLPIAGSFGGHALQSNQIQWTGDVEGDPRWSQHSKAQEGREYASLVSVPLSVRDQVVGVLNVVSTSKQAFSEADRTYVELLGSILSLAWGLADWEGESN